MGDLITLHETHGVASHIAGYGKGYEAAAMTLRPDVRRTSTPPTPSRANASSPFLVILGIAYELLLMTAPCTISFTATSTSRRASSR